MHDLTRTGQRPPSNRMLILPFRVAVAQELNRQSSFAYPRSRIQHPSPDQEQFAALHSGTSLGQGQLTTGAQWIPPVFQAFFGGFKVNQPKKDADSFVPMATGHLGLNSGAFLGLCLKPKGWSNGIPSARRFLFNGFRGPVQAVTVAIGRAFVQRF